MGDVIFVYLGAIIEACLRWFIAIFESTGTTFYVISGITITIVTTLFLIPIRGRSLPGGFKGFFSGRNKGGDD